MLRKLIGLCPTIFMLLMLPAHAAGGLACTYQDENAQLVLNSGVTHGMGRQLFSFSGNLNLQNQRVPDDFHEITFESDHIAQYWFDDREFRLVLYRERVPERAHGYVQVTVITRTTNEVGLYTGEWIAEVFDTEPSVQLRLGGNVTCSAE